LAVLAAVASLNLGENGMAFADAEPKAAHAADVAAAEKALVADALAWAGIGSAL